MASSSNGNGAGRRSRPSEPPEWTGSDDEPAPGPSEDDAREGIVVASRLGRLARERWFLGVAALVLALLVTAVLLIWSARRRPPWVVTPGTAPSSDAISRARTLRQRGLERCHRSAWEECLRDLDEAKRLDPIGDRASAIESARLRAMEARSPRMPRPEAGVASPPAASPSSE